MWNDGFYILEHSFSTFHHLFSIHLNRDAVSFPFVLKFIKNGSPNQAKSSFYLDTGGQITKLLCPLTD